MNNKDVERIAHELIAGRLAAGQEVERDWAIYEILLQQEEITGGGTPFYRLCTREHLKAVVKKVIGKYDQPQEEDGQMILKGFVHLQSAYPVERDKKRVLVPIDSLSDEELRMRAGEYRTQGAGYFVHADEIERYIEIRRKGQEEGAA